MTEALIVVDIQNDYFPGGAMELVGSDAACDAAVQIKAEYKSKGLPVFMVQHIAQSATATFFLSDTHGVEIHPSLALTQDDIHVVKHYPNSFRGTILQSELQARGITKVTVIGMMTHMCIDTTVRAASDLGYSVTVIAEACATTNLSFGDRTVEAADVQAAYLAALDGSFAKVVS